MLKLDLSGLEALTDAAKTLKDNIPDTLASFLRTEFSEFVRVNAADPSFPYDTGDLLNSISMSEIRHAAGVTEADRSFMAHYASFVNDGTRNPDGSRRIYPRRFNERAISQVQRGQEQRFNALLERIFAALLQSGSMPSLPDA